MEKLKPCPFCGNYSGYIVHQSKGMWKVSCSHGCVEQSAWFFTKDAARKAWNRRAEMSEEECEDENWYTELDDPKIAERSEDGNGN